MMDRSEKNAGKAQAQWETHTWEKHGRLRISENGHYIEHEDGTGFFWLGDTGWLIARLTPDSEGGPDGF